MKSFYINKYLVIFVKEKLNKKIMNYVEINGEDVDLDDYLDEFGDQTLIKELEW